MSNIIYYELYICVHYAYRETLIFNIQYDRVGTMKEQVWLTKKHHLKTSLIFPDDDGAVLVR